MKRSSGRLKFQEKQIPYLHQLLTRKRHAKSDADDDKVEARSVNQIYNTNADTAAGVIAKELSADNIIFQTDVPGVFDSNRRVIPQMTKNQALDLIQSGIVQGGMIPKIKSCIDALDSVNVGRIIDGRNSGALLSAFTNGNIGTRIV